MAIVPIAPETKRSGKRGRPDKAVDGFDINEWLAQVRPGMYVEGWNLVNSCRQWVCQTCNGVVSDSASNSGRRNSHFYAHERQKRHTIGVARLATARPPSGGASFDFSSLQGSELGNASCVQMG